MGDVENWNADMEAWGLTGSARAHHLMRLHDYHRRVEALHWRRWDRWDGIERWFFVVAGVAALIGLIATLAGGGR